MHPLVFDAFQAICATLPSVPDVLEIGASPAHRMLLSLPALHGAARRVGVGLDGPFDGGSYQLLHADAHDLSMFADAGFGLVLCNSLLEHDPHFWLTLAEARRVLAPGGWMVLGVPGYGAMGRIRLPPPGRLIARMLARLPRVGAAWRDLQPALDASSLTLGVHNFPGDYYRFSAQAMAEVLLAGLEQVTVRSILAPPRLIGYGRKPSAA